MEGGCTSFSVDGDVLVRHFISVPILQFYTRCHSGIAEVRMLRERFVNTCRTLQHLLSLKALNLER